MPHPRMSSRHDPPPNVLWKGSRWGANTVAEMEVSTAPSNKRRRASEHRTGVRYENRELSWLEFNARVLALAEDPDVPLLERVRFLAIYSNNLDEFFQVRVAGLHEQLAAGAPAGPDGLSPAETARRDPGSCAHLVDPQESVPHEEPAARSREAGHPDRRVGGPVQGGAARDASAIRGTDLPGAHPLAVDPAHPFPYVSDLSLSLAVVVRDPTVAPAAVRAREGAAETCHGSSLSRRGRATSRSSRWSPPTSTASSRAWRS